VLSCLFFGLTNNKPFASIFDGNIIPLLFKYDPRIKANTHNPITPLQSIFYNDCSLFGWAIRAKNVPVITYLFRKGMNPNKVVDIKENNTSLHYAVLYGNLMVVDTVLNAHDEILHLEQVNGAGLTAAMIASKTGNFQITKKLLRCGCHGRTALGGKYWGWLLAMVRQRERLEMNTQTGVYGDDDETYFSNRPDPNYLIWGWK
jgi:ankyrin repeat protein